MSGPNQSTLETGIVAHIEAVATTARLVEATAGSDLQNPEAARFYSHLAALHLKQGMRMLERLKAAGVPEKQLQEVI